MGGALARRFAERLPGVALHNLYGPTEAAIDVSFHACDTASARAAVPIGRPIANMQLYVLDAHLQPLPVGVPGELHIGGIGLARGYLHRPELTAQKFIPSPFDPEPGARLYKTGDLARWLPDGSLEFLGRRDHQLKLSGVRLELGEIEAVLSTHSDVAACVVVARQEAPGDVRLVAYVVLHDGHTLDAAALRRHLLLRLPEEVVPAVFVALPALPCGSSGKVDRDALPAPPRERARQACVAPRTADEAVVAELFASALRLDRVGLDEDFFALGGHSLKAVALVAQIVRDTGAPLTLPEFFGAPTVAAVVRRIAGGGGERPPLEADSTLPEALRIALPPDGAPPRSLLLTGATGFVGAFVLHVLNKVAGLQVTCLVRGADDVTASARLRDALATWGLQVDWSRVRALRGDLASAGLGLDAAAWDALARAVDGVVHCGTEVHHSRGYASLRPANVGGTLALLRLSAAGRTRRFCLVSSLDAAHATPGATEQTPLLPPWRGSGYAQTKWVSDRLVLAAADAGHDAVVCRVGLVLGDSEQGRLPDTGYWPSQVLRACVRTGAVPCGLDLPAHAIPVDLAAQAIVAQALDRRAPRVLHVGGTEHLTTQAVADALAETGMSAVLVSASSGSRGCAVLPSPTRSSSGCCCSCGTGIRCRPRGSVSGRERRCCGGWAPRYPRCGRRSHRR